MTSSPATAAELARRILNEVFPGQHAAAAMPADGQADTPLPRTDSARSRATTSLARAASGPGEAQAGA
jgi:hypothetical protein